MTRSRLRVTVGFMTPERTHVLELRVQMSTGAEGWKRRPFSVQSAVRFSWVNVMFRVSAW